jgi:dipeptidyl aminopeptidase/acylaminoacyl peptidase
VAWGAIYDYHATWKRRIEMHDKNTFWLRATISPGCWVDNLKQSLRNLEKFSMNGVARFIKYPFLITHGEADVQTPIEDARKLYNKVGSKDETLRIFTNEEGGATHCMMDNRSLDISYIADWLADHLVS